MDKVRYVDPIQQCFLSIVENRDNKLELLVRARIKGDIEKIFPEADVLQMIVQIINTEHSFLRLRLRLG